MDGCWVHHKVCNGMESAKYSIVKSPYLFHGHYMLNEVGTFTLVSYYTCYNIIKTCNRQLIISPWEISFLRGILKTEILVSLWFLLTFAKFKILAHKCNSKCTLHVVISVIFNKINSFIQCVSWC